MKNFIKKVFCPNFIIGFILFNLGFGLLIYVFANKFEGTPLAYVSYILSSYALIIFCLWFYKVCNFGRTFLKKTKVYSLYKNNSTFLTKASMYFSLIFNLIYGIFKLGIGFYYSSWWFITFAIYYLLLCFMKLSLVKNIDNKEKEYIKLKYTGILLLLLNLILIGIIILIVKHDQVIKYSGFIIYLVALYDFYILINAVINVVKYRKNHSPILTASKCISLTVALISLISLEVAMISEFGNNDSKFKLIMTCSLGLGVCLINSFMSIYMIIKSQTNNSIHH